MKKFIAYVQETHSYMVHMETMNTNGQALTGGDYSFTMERKEGTRYQFKTKKSRDMWVTQANTEAGKIVCVAIG